MDILKILKNFLDSDGKLTSLPSKRKMKIYAVYYLSTKLESNKTYTEREVNEILDKWNTFGDHSTLRRELCNFKFLERKDDSSAYWLAENQPDVEALIAQ